MPAHEILCEGFARLESRRIPARPNDSQAALFKLIDDACSQGSFRPHNAQIK